MKLVKITGSFYASQTLPYAEELRGNFVLDEDGSFLYVQKNGQGYCSLGFNFHEDGDIVKIGEILGTAFEESRKPQPAPSDTVNNFTTQAAPTTRLPTETIIGLKGGALTVEEMIALRKEGLL